MPKFQLQSPKDKAQVPIADKTQPYVLVVTGKGVSGSKNTIQATLTLSVGGGAATQIDNQPAAIAPRAWVAVLTIPQPVATGANAVYSVTVQQAQNSETHAFTLVPA